VLVETLNTTHSLALNRWHIPDKDPHFLPPLDMGEWLMPDCDVANLIDIIELTWDVGLYTYTAACHKIWAVGPLSLICGRRGGPCVAMVWPVYE